MLVANEILNMSDIFRRKRSHWETGPGLVWKVFVVDNCMSLKMDSSSVLLFCLSSFARNKEEITVRY